MLEKVGGILVNTDFWDCECAFGYHHDKRKGDYICSRCGCREDEEPDSIQNELIQDGVVPAEA